MNAGTNCDSHRHWCCLFAALAFVGWGCAETNPPAATPVASPAAPTANRGNSSVLPPLSEPAATAPAAPVAANSQQAQPGAPVAAPAKTAASPAPANNAAARIRLSAGVALAQTLPEGTTVMCSMDYQWIEGGPQQGCEYGWVVELGNGQRVAGPAKVSKQRGTIQLILHGVKPDQGPFKGAVFAKMPGASPEQISEFVSLK